MSPYKKYLVLFSLALSPLLGCQKEDPKPYYPVSAELISFYNYKVGSYWIMEDSSTHFRDSFAVVKYERSTTSTSSSDKEQVVIVIKDYPLWGSSGPVTWQLVLGDSYRADLSYQSFDNITNGFFPALLSPPDTSNALHYEQGGKSYENSYETSRGYISTINPHAPDTMIVTTVFNRDYGLIRLKANIPPDYKYDWRLTESKIVR